MVRAPLLFLSAVSGSPGQAPIFEASKYTVSSHSPTGKFKTYDVFQLDGVVDKASGHIKAKLLSGTSPDHDIVFGNASCTPSACRWPLTIMLDGKNSSGECLFFAQDNYTSLTYTELEASLHPEPVPHCGDALPEFKESVYKAYVQSSTSPFDSGDHFQLDGVVGKTSGKIVAKHITGKGPDHEIIFGNSTCQGTSRHWPLTITLEGKKSTGSTSFYTTSKSVSLVYSELKAQMLPVPPPNCGDALPTFKSSLYQVSTSANSTFENGDYFHLDGAVDKTSGKVEAKHVSGKSPDHELIFGNSTCEGTMRSWPFTAVIGGKKSHGSCSFSTQHGKSVSISYDEQEASLRPAQISCDAMRDKETCTGNVTMGSCAWCVSADNVHELCFTKSGLPDEKQWDCGSSSLAVV